MSSNIVLFPDIKRHLSISICSFDVSYLNLMAIEFLELAGFFHPTEEQIEIIEKALEQVIQVNG